MERSCVLVVDDDREIRVALAAILVAEGYGVLEAANGEEALEVLRTGVRPSVILLDLMMADRSGWRFFDERDKDPRLVGIPVIVLSAFPDSAEARARRASDYLRKPVDFDSVIEVVEQHC